MTIKDLARRGVVLASRLTFKSAAPLDAETLALLEAHKAELLRELTAPDAVPPLPWQLQLLLGAAGADVLNVELRGVPDPSRYALAWGCAYLIGDREEALRRLWQVYRTWQGVN